jgi:hypothetical protein
MATIRDKPGHWRSLTFRHGREDEFAVTTGRPDSRCDGSLEASFGRGVLPLEGRGAVLEERLLPLVEQGGGELMLIAEVRDGHVVDLHFRLKQDLGFAPILPPVGAVRYLKFSTLRSEEQP